MHPALLDVYSTYRSKGFEVVGIATDASTYGKDLPVVIKKHHLSWLQYWDLNGKGAADLSIQAFPMNFLLDENGLIIRKNIKSPELATFLAEQL